MNLIELHPKWLREAWSNAPDWHLRQGQGVSFDCPVCRTHKLAVMFDNPLDGRAAAPGHLLWHREGETFETLTLSPSINAQQMVPPLAPDLVL